MNEYFAVNNIPKKTNCIMYFKYFIKTTKLRFDNIIISVKSNFQPERLRN